MAATKQTDGPLNPWAKAGMSLAVLGIASVLALDLAYPDIEKTMSLKFPETLPGLSGTVKQKSDPHFGVNKTYNLELTIKGKAGETYRVQIRGDRPSNPDAMNFGLGDSRPVYDNSGPMTFTTNQAKSLSYSLSGIPGSAEIEVFYNSDAGQEKHFRSFVTDLVRL